MGIDVRLENEEGKRLDEVLDTASILPRILPAYEDETFHLLRFVDRWGNTIFNSLHMTEFLKEWERIGSKLRTADEVEVHSKVRQLAQRCKAQAHTYLKFVGD